MNQVQWTAVDGYFAEHLLRVDPVLDAAFRQMQPPGLPAIDVSPVQGKFLHLLALSKGARRILEVGTLGGYSTIWLARALPADGRMITLELNPKHAQWPGPTWSDAGVSEKVEIRVGAAAGSLAQLHNEGAEPFDMIFIDADKPGNSAYVQGALKLARRGTLIVIDNVVREGAILDPASTDRDVQGTRARSICLPRNHGSHPRPFRRSGVKNTMASPWQL